MAKTAAELVFIPTPAVGHVVSIIQFAKLLLDRHERLSVTILVINPLTGPDSNLSITSYTESWDKKTKDRIRFVELTRHDETLKQLDPKAPMSFLNEFIKVHCKSARKVVADMISQSGSSQIVGFVLDMFCMSMMDVATEFDLPSYIFFTSNASFLSYEFYIQTLCDTQKKDVYELSNSDGEVLIPGFKNPVPTKVFPAVFQSQEGLDILLYSVRKFREAKAIIVNTFLELETHVIESLSSDTSLPAVYPVGPILNLHGVSRKVEEDDIIGWLDTQQPSSVVFLCFGSMGSFDEVEVKEIAYALERSGHRFLWSLRLPPSPVMDVAGDYKDPKSLLPEGFLERTSGLGKVIGWAPQVAVLAHPAVGGFVSHCGWNSLLESLWFGVPAAAWPIYAEQQLNAFQMVVEMGLAVDVKWDYKKDLFNLTSGNPVRVTAEEIEMGIRQVMEDDQMRAKMKEMSKMSRAAVAGGGSSYASIGCLVQEFTNKLSSV